MMRRFIFLLLLAHIAPLQANEFWHSLWRNADQRGEALMQQGDPASAAKIYSDPRRKAYAKIQAGDYAGAAQDLANVHDSDSDYNRGNALAHTGDLQAALDAYDAALKSAPRHQDARHNRELVANALKQQAQQDKKSGDSKDQKDKSEGESKKSDKGQDSTEQNKSPQPGKEDSSKADKKQDGQGKEGQAKDSQGKENQGKEKKPAEDKSKQEKAAGKNSQGSKEQGNSADKQPAQAGQKNEQERAKDDAEQARSEQQARLASTGEDAKKGAASVAEAPPARKSEQQIAQEQWLRSIPDDPSGLLRRKFLIEHSIRQQKAKQ